MLILSLNLFVFCSVKLGWDEVYSELKELAEFFGNLPPWFLTNSEQFIEVYRPASIIADNSQPWSEPEQGIES